MSEVSDEKAIITIEVELVGKVTGDPTKVEERPDFFGLPPEVEDVEEKSSNFTEREEVEKEPTEFTEREGVEKKPTEFTERGKVEKKPDVFTAEGKKVEEKPTEEETDNLTEIIEETVRASVEESVDDALEEAGVDSDTIEKMKNLTQDIDAKGISNVKQLAKNPQAFMESTFMKVLSRAGPYGALAAAIIAMIAGAPDLVRAVVEALGVKGGPLNQDYAFTEEEQYGQAFSRQVQFRRVTGDDPVITVTTKGFVAGDKDFVDNSLVDVETGRMGRVDLNQASLGYIHGV